MESILTSVKKLLGPDESYDAFDQDIIMNINSVLMTLNQLGVGPESGFNITGSSETWTDLFGERKDLSAVKMYIYLKVRLAFDPPQNGFLVDAITKQCTELEWRINIQAEGDTNNG